MTTKNWEFGKCSEPRKLSVFEITIDMKLKKPEGLFSRGEYEELSIKKFVTITITREKIRIVKNGIA